MTIQTTTLPAQMPEPTKLKTMVSLSSRWRTPRSTPRLVSFSWCGTQAARR